MKILVVDDDRDLADVPVFSLDRFGFASAVAYNAPGLLRHLDENLPDLVVVDINFGSHNGFDLLHDLRQRSRLPVMVISGRTAEDDTVRITLFRLRRKWEPDPKTPQYLRTVSGVGLQFYVEPPPADPLPPVKMATAAAANTRPRAIA